MKTRQLGNSRLEVSALGFGCMGLNSGYATSITRDDGIALIRAAVLWLLSLGIFDKEYAKPTSDSTDEHKYTAPDLFTAETPLGTYQGMTDQVVMSRTPGAYRTVLVPRSCKPEWLAVQK